MEVGMGQKITISVSDDLHKKLQANKGEFKVSKICQNALENAIDLTTLCNKHDISALKKRLERERYEIFKDHWKEGINDGKSDAFKFDYLTFNKCIGYFKEDNGDDQSKWAAFEYFANKEHVNKYSAIESGELDIPTDSEKIDDRFWGDAADIYFLGWCIGVQTVYEKTKNCNERG
jgi:hypothetical protein